ncbi:MAG TPA: hypothetical protein PKN33_03105 [Phycisphaerae bacterium]|nr:hypothetical protein [Phycisphaerae bacterium]
MTKRRLQFDPIIERLGIGAEFKQIPESEREYIYLRKSPRPEIVLDNSAALHPRGGDAKMALDAALDSIQLELPQVNASVSLAECGMFLGPIHAWLCRAGRRANTPGMKALAEKIIPVLDAAMSEQQIFVRAKLLCVASSFSRIDNGFFCCCFEHKRMKGGRFRLVIPVKVVPPQVDRVRRSGHDSLKAYRVGIPLVGRDFQWLRWDPRALGLKRPAGEHPVLLTSHALRQYEKRVPFYRDSDPIHDSIMLSLYEPIVVSPSNDRLMVAHEIWDRRFGYWCFRFDGQQFVADTFLFLTMDGTPEGDRLRKHLKLERADRERLMLDTLDSFLASDIRNDNELVLILTNCGCGHLFEFARKADFEILITGSAEYARQFIGPDRLNNALTLLSTPS